MTNKIPNFDRNRALVIGVILFIFIVSIVDECIYYFIRDYIIYPRDEYNITEFYDFIFIIGFLLSLSISTYFSSRDKVKKFAKFSLKYFGVAFILGIVLFLVLVFFGKHIPTMRVYTALILLFFLLNIFDRLDKLEK